MDFETPIVTVDVVLLTVRDGRLCVGLVERTGEPFAGQPSLTRPSRSLSIESAQLVSGVSGIV